MTHFQRQDLQRGLCYARHCSVSYNSGGEGESYDAHRFDRIGDAGIGDPVQINPNFYIYLRYRCTAQLRAI